MVKVIPTISSFISSGLQTLPSPPSPPLFTLSLLSLSSSSTSNPGPNQHSPPNPSPNPNPHHRQRNAPTSNPNHNPNQQYTLTSQQQEVLSAVASGRSVFITGSAGTGKTFLLSIIIRLLKRMHHPSSVFVTASTGVAACSLPGQTLHSFAGIGLGSGDLPSLFSKISSSKSASQRWISAKALIIDEISMIDGQLFDHLDCIARKMRPWGEHLPWGGIQLVVSGDFFQLPPIKAPNLRKEFAFEAKCWGICFDLQVELSRVFRQSDEQLIDVLQGIRRGVKDDKVARLLSAASSWGFDENDDSITRIFPRNKDVRKLNNEKLRSLGREVVTYRAVDTGKNPWKARLKQGIAPEELEICEGARVMLIKNTNVGIGLVNGATGTVTGFVNNENGKVRNMFRGGGVLPRVKFDMGVEMVVTPERWVLVEGEKIRATRRQLPIILAWALSVHKCQGMTLDRLHADLSRAFGCGMVYVALSRVRSLAGLRLTGFNLHKIRAHPKVLRFYEQLLCLKP